VVNEALEGLCLSNPELARIEGTQIIVLKKKSEGKVNLICGGGSGHEPAHASFVDPCMLEAAVCGGVFASPSTEEVFMAIQHAATPHGVLVVIKNYTGDVINFTLAASYAEAKGIKCKILIVGDDISFIESDDPITKGAERGLAGTCILYKILGAAASEGKTLDEVHSLG
jgi:dihydroxyacetone kinase